MDLIPQVSASLNFSPGIQNYDANGAEQQVASVSEDYKERERRRQDRGRERRKESRWNTDKPSRRSRSRSKDRDRDRDRDRKRDRDIETDDRDRERRAKDRPRERDRERDRDKDRDEFRDRRDRDRDRDRERRDRDRDRDRDKRRRSDDITDKDGDLEDKKTSRSRERSHDYGDDDYDYKRDKVSVPTQLVMLRNLPFSVTEDEIAAELQTKGLNYKEIRIVKDKYGDSKGIGFVEFHDVSVSERWTYLTQGIIHLDDRTVQLEYSRPKPLPKPASEHDWECNKCQTLNYASRKRTSCFSCGAQRDEATEDKYDRYEDELKYDERDSRDTVSREAPMVAPPCNVLILRGLDLQTPEETVRNAIVQLTNTPIYDVRLIKDKVTGMSRGFCFVELGSTKDATALLDRIQDSEPPYSIEGKRVYVGYAKNSHNPPPSRPRERPEPKPKPASTTPVSKAKAKSNLASVAIAQAQAAQLQGEYNFQYDGQQSQDQSQQYAQGVPASQHATASSQYQSSYASQSQADYTQTYSQASHEQYQQSQYQQSQYQQDQYQQYYQQQQAVSQQSQTQQQAYQYTAPQPTSSYVYDPNTGYYYDSSTGLYYDANSGYYYNGNTGQFLYWDAQQQQYLIVNQDGTFSSATASAESTDTTTVTDATRESRKKVDAKPSSFNAKKIAKDMERWARQQNKAKTARKDAVLKAQLEQQEREAKEEAIRKQMEEEGLGTFTKPAAPVSMPVKEQKKAPQLAKSLFTADVEDDSPLVPFAVNTKETSSKPSHKSLVAEYGADEDSDEEEKVDDKFADYTIMACLLCKRRFPNKEGLVKHQQLSDLHRQNLERYKDKLKSEVQEISAQMLGRGR